MRITCTYVLAILAFLAHNAMGQSTIVGSDHDFSRDIWAKGQVCLPCHTPQRTPFAKSVDDQQNKILWNHDLTTATFTMYSPLRSGRLISGQPGESSKMCLSCHDGTTAIDSYGGSIGSRFMIGSNDIGTDLRDDHPIGLVYPTGAPGYKHPSGFPPGGVKLVSGEGIANRVECNSCHDPHGAGYGSFLRGSMMGSALCLQCHAK